MPQAVGEAVGGLPPGCRRIENQVFLKENESFLALAPRGGLWDLSGPYRGRVGCTLASQGALWDLSGPPQECL